MAWDDIPSWSVDTTTAILRTVKEKDPFTFYHCCRVGRGSRLLAKALGLNEFEQAVMEYSGLYHDVGKVGIPDSILLKPGRLDKDEVEVMKLHPLKSAEILEPLAGSAFFRFLLPGVRYHHERFSGEGYPFGLSGEHIPLAARLISVVDAFDAMTNVRSYRKSLPRDKVIAELQAFSGQQFDPQIVKVFLDALPHIEGGTFPAPEKEEVVIAKVLKVA